MKNIFITTISLGLLASCAPKNLEEQVKAKKQELAELTTAYKDAEKPLRTEIDSLVKLMGGKVERLTSVEIDTLAPSNFNSYFEVHGVVQTNQNIQVMPETQGIIQSIRVREGQKVKKGEILATIDTETIQKQINELKKSLELATIMLEKQQNLRDNNVGTEIAFLQAKNQKESLDKTISTLQSQKEKAVLRAPISGTMDDIFPRVGEMASPSMPFARIINVDNIYIKAEVSEASIGKVNVGDAVTVNVPSVGKKINATISYVGNFINPLNRTFTIHVNLPNHDRIFMPNLLTELRIRDAHFDNAIAVPTKVILNDGHNNYAYIVEKENGTNIVKKQLVETGVDYDGSIIITEGLKAGQLVVIEGQTVVSDGIKVSISQD